MLVFVNYGAEYCNNEQSRKICLFSEQNLEENNLTIFLTSILTASSAILAISFFITQTTISNLWQNYSVGALKEFLQTKHIYQIFFVWIILVVFASVITLLLNFITIFWSFVASIFIMDVFIFSLLLFTKQYYNMISISNPYNFIDTIKASILEHIRNPK